MNKLLKTGVSLLLCGGMALSLSACSVIRNIKENAAREDAVAILPSPADREAVAAYNAALANALTCDGEVDVSVRFRVRNAKAESDGENAELELLDAAAKQLTSLIMANDPGAADETIPLSQTAGTLLVPLDDSSVLDLSVDRNYTSEKVTDEKGNEQKDENGEAVTERFVSDNRLELTFRYYRDTVVRGETTDADGNTEEAVTDRSFADDGTVETVFGEKRDKEAILAEFDCVKDYLQVNDYTVAYTDCTVKSEIDLDLNLPDSVTFSKNMTVTAEVTGRGSLAALGDFRVTFDVGEETRYVFRCQPEPAAE